MMLTKNIDSSNLRDEGEESCKCRLITQGDEDCDHGGHGANSCSNPEGGCTVSCNTNFFACCIEGSSE